MTTNAMKTARRREWIPELAKGKSFADVGGLWGTTNEKISVAARAGARSLTMIDVAPPGDRLWKDFDARCATLGVSGYRNISIDILDPGFRERVGRFDIVHCSGVLYHMPDMVQFVRRLMSITGEYLMLTSVVVPERIENEYGAVDLSGGKCLFIPLIDEWQRKIIGQYLTELKIPVPHINLAAIPKWFYDGVWTYGPWSWLITSGFLRGLAQVCDLTVEDEGFCWEGKAYSLLCRMP